MMTASPSTRRGFTLIEILVVIAIIAILMGLVFPALTSGIRTAKISKAQSEAKNIEGAIFLFKKDYGYFPVPKNAQAVASDGGLLDDTGSKSLLQVLMAEPLNYNLNDQLNTRKQNYLDMDALGTDGTLEDPWGKQYRMKLDLNYDGEIDYPSSGDTYKTTVIVVSSGPDRAFDTDDDIATVEL
jgi:prepilin-type N-terminal cleavage/methylation domain-containing protein